MKNKINKYIATLLVGGLMGFSACTDNFVEQNTNNAGFPEDLQKYDYQTYVIPLGIIQEGIYFNYDWGSGKNWTFQVMQNLSSDMYSGYFHDMNGSFNDKNSTYNLNDAWTSSTWVNTYGYIMPIVQKSEKINTEDNYPAFVGVTNILKVELMHRISDMYGPIVYTQFGSSTGSAPDTQKEAYYAFFKDLDDATNQIKGFMTENPGANTFAKADITMPAGMRTYASWIKFANSLRLRLAMRISNVDPSKAKEEAMKALDSNAGGLLETAAEIVAISTESGYTNPLGEINKSWGEVFMNANMESILKGYEDPRISKYFDLAAEGGTPTLFPIDQTYKGVRQGTGVKDHIYQSHSKSTIAQTSNAILMTSAEVWFLRAEAALRGYIAGDAGELYRRGVETSFEQWGAGNASDYLESDKLPADYKDAFDTKFDVPAASKVSPKWDNAAGQEVKLEKIITQKWIACYPEGCEPWAEQRRTGYPKLFKVAVNNSQGTIDTDIMIRRLIFPQALKNDNPTQYNQLTTALGGADTGGTRLWWDTGKNF